MWSKRKVSSFVVTKDKIQHSDFEALIKNNYLRMLQISEVYII